MLSFLERLIKIRFFVDSEELTFLINIDSCYLIHKNNYEFWIPDENSLIQGSLKYAMILVSWKKSIDPWPLKINMDLRSLKKVINPGSLKISTGPYPWKQVKILDSLK